MYETPYGSTDPSSVKTKTRGFELKNQNEISLSPPDTHETKMLRKIFGTVGSLNTLAASDESAGEAFRAGSRSENTSSTKSHPPIFYQGRKYVYFGVEKMKEKGVIKGFCPAGFYDNSVLESFGTAGNSGKQDDDTGASDTVLLPPSVMEHSRSQRLMKTVRDVKSIKMQFAIPGNEEWVFTDAAEELSSGVGEASVQNTDSDKRASYTDFRLNNTKKKAFHLLFQYKQRESLRKFGVLDRVSCLPTGNNVHNDNLALEVYLHRRNTNRGERNTGKPYELFEGFFEPRAPNLGSSGPRPSMTGKRSLSV